MEPKQIPRLLEAARGVTNVYKELEDGREKVCNGKSCHYPWRG